MLVIILEDDRTDRQLLEDMCVRYAREEAMEVETLPFAAAGELLCSPRAMQADVLLLDLVMGGGADDGVRVARTLREQRFEGAIIFATGSSDYYPEGFEVAATHYLLKPFAYAAFHEAMQRAVLMRGEAARTVAVTVNRVRVNVPIKNILYVEVYGRESMLHTCEEVLEVRMPLSDIEQLLDGDRFLRCFRSYLINMQHVRQMEEDHFVMDNGDRIPIRMRNRQEIREKYLSYRVSAL